MGEVFAQPAEGAAAGGDDALFVALAEAHPYLALVEIEVLQLQEGEFLASQAGGVEQLEHGAVPNAEGIGDVGDLEKGLHGVQWKIAGKPMGWRSRRFEALKGIVFETGVGGEPVCEAFQIGEQVGSGMWCRLGIEQVLLEGEDVPDRDQGGQPFESAPVMDEQPFPVAEECPAVGLDGGRRQVSQAEGGKPVEAGLVIGSGLAVLERVGGGRQAAFAVLPGLHPSGPADPLFVAIHCRASIWSKLGAGRSGFKDWLSADLDQGLAGSECCFDLREERLEPGEESAPTRIAGADPHDPGAAPGLLPSEGEVFVLGQDDHLVDERVIPYRGIRTGMKPKIHHVFRGVAE